MFQVVLLKCYSHVRWKSDDLTVKRPGIRNDFFVTKAKINAMFTDAQQLLLLFLCSLKCM